MKKMPQRDITGKCRGECRDRVSEGNKERQAEMRKIKVKSPDSYPEAPGAKDRDIPPGAYGGHV